MSQRQRKLCQRMTPTQRRSKHYGANTVELFTLIVLNLFISSAILGKIKKNYIYETV